MKKDKNSRFVKNLVECDGPYIICLKLNEAKRTDKLNVYIKSKNRRK